MAKKKFVEGERALVEKKHIPHWLTERGYGAGVYVVTKVDACGWRELKYGERAYENFYVNTRCLKSAVALPLEDLV